MNNLAGVRKKAHNITSFVENSIAEGQTYENQANFNVLLQQLADEIKASHQNGVAIEEVYKVIKEEGVRIAADTKLNSYMKMLIQSSNNWNSKRRDKKGIVMS